MLLGTQSRENASFWTQAEQIGVALPAGMQTHVVIVDCITRVVTAQQFLELIPSEAGQVCSRLLCMMAEQTMMKPGHGCTEEHYAWLPSYMSFIGVHLWFALRNRQTLSSL